MHSIELHEASAQEPSACDSRLTVTSPVIAVDILLDLDSANICDVTCDDSWSEVIRDNGDLDRLSSWQSAVVMDDSDATRRLLESNLVCYQLR